jgi:hypothetical protein
MTVEMTEKTGWTPSAPTAVTPITKNKDKEVFGVKGRIFWANMDVVNEASGKYQLDLCNLSEAAVAKLKSLNISVLEKTDGRDSYVTIKSTHTLDAFDVNGERINQRIGNGSEALAMLTYYDWPAKFGPGRSASLVKLTITNLVSFDGAGAVDENTEVF